ncbi:MAG: hypothetical protein JW724_06655 [Candidatus Altiarchaeota archaeon]|nr:hypothetical protein [Candidatus Altiarchaeota archaeon]
MKNKDLAIGFIIVGLFVVVFSYYLFLNKVTDKNKNGAKVEVQLSEFQITACNAAERGDACETKLPKLNLISAADCCKYLGKCCKK